VAVSIPIIKALREGLVANRIEWLAGIVNGTSNFILSEMQDKGISFAAALQQAQARGYAEADPRLDVDGTDAAHKLSLLAANAFGLPIPYAQVQTEGIADLEAADMAYAAQLGYRIKLLAQARRSAAGLLLQVHPALLPQDHLLAGVQGSMNAVMVHSDAAGTSLYYGAGAGSEQTASAVIADLVDLARARGLVAVQQVPHLGFQSRALQALPPVPEADAASAWYLRLHSTEPGRSAAALQLLLAQAGVDLRALHRFDPATAAAPAALVLLTGPVPTHRLRPLLQQLAQAPGAVDAPRAIHMARLD
jgi:homoserine dehydrogenase